MLRGGARYSVPVGGMVAEAMELAAWRAPPSVMRSSSKTERPKCVTYGDWFAEELHWRQQESGLLIYTSCNKVNNKENVLLIRCNFCSFRSNLFLLL